MWSTDSAQGHFPAWTIWTRKLKSRDEPQWILRPNARLGRLLSHDLQNSSLSLTSWRRNRALGQLRGFTKNLTDFLVALGRFLFSGMRSCCNLPGLLRKPSQCLVALLHATWTENIRLTESWKIFAWCMARKKKFLFSWTDVCFEEKKRHFGLFPTTQAFLA